MTKVTKRTAKKIFDRYDVDVTTINTVEEIVNAFKRFTYKVVMEADILDTTIHYIEDVSGEIITFITDENDNNKIVKIEY